MDELEELLKEAEFHLQPDHRQSRYADYLIAKFIIRGGRKTHKEIYEQFKKNHPDRDWDDLEKNPHIYLDL